MIAAYRKLIVAVVGLVILLVNRQWGFDLGPQENLIVDGIISALTAFGVWKVENEKPTA